LVRQGSVLGATISANSLGTVVTDAQNGRADTKMGNIHIQPLCFQDDIAAVGNTKVEVLGISQQLKYTKIERDYSYIQTKANVCILRNKRKTRIKKKCYY